MVTIELSASGIAGLQPVLRQKGTRHATPSPLNTLIAKRIAQNTRIRIDSFCPKLSRFIWRGVFFSEVLFNRLAILPTICVHTDAGYQEGTSSVRNKTS